MGSVVWQLTGSWVHYGDKPWEKPFGRLGLENNLKTSGRKSDMGTTMSSQIWLNVREKIAYENIHKYMYTDIIVNRMVKIPIHHFGRERRKRWWQQECCDREMIK